MNQTKTNWPIHICIQIKQKQTWTIQNISRTKKNLELKGIYTRDWLNKKSFAVEMSEMNIKLEAHSWIYSLFFLR